MTKLRLNFKNLLTYLGILTIFGDAFTYRFFPFFEFRISYLILGLVLLALLPFCKEIPFNRTFLFLFFIIICNSLINIFLGNGDIFSLLKQIIGISFNSTVFYLLIRFNQNNVKKLFSIYLNFAFFVGLIGLVQWVSFLLGFKPGYDYHYILPHWQVVLSLSGNFLRVNSIFPEPIGFCVVMLPAFFASLVSFTNNKFQFLSKWRSFVIILSYTFSLSSMGYIGMIFSIILLFLNYNKLKYILISLALVFTLFFIFYNTIDDFKLRVSESAKVLSGKVPLGETNLSTTTLFSNAFVAYNSFKNNPLFGSGLGSHELSYGKYIHGIEIRKSYLSVNAKDANSLFLRLLSETGLFGLVIIFIFIYNFYISRRNDATGYLWVISNAVLSLFVMRLVRVGHYFTDGFFFFVWLYYFSKIELKRREIV